MKQMQLVGKHVKTLPRALFHVMVSTLFIWISCQMLQA